MKNLEFNTQICTTIEQSKRLLKLGLDADTSDMLIIPLPNGKELIVQKFADESGNLYYKIKGEQWESSPAWSLHRLIAMLPDFFSNLGRQFNLKMDKCFLRYCTARNDEYIYFQQKDTLYDNIIDCIEWLIKENHINKNYLKEE
jgi:hypothetical protein